MEERDVYRWEDMSGDGEYMVQLVRYVVDEDDEHEYDHEGSTVWRIDDEGEWEKHSGPGPDDPWGGPSDPETEGDINVIGEVEDKWLDTMAPKILQHSVEEVLIDDYGFNFAGKSGRSEASYLKHPEDSDVRIRIATHEPAYQSSHDAYSILLGMLTTPDRYAQRYYLPVPSTPAQINKATHAASEWADEQVEARTDEEDW